MTLFHSDQCDLCRATWPFYPLSLLPQSAGNKIKDPHQGTQQAEEDDPLACLNDARSATAVFQTTYDNRKKQDALDGKVLR